MAVTIVIASQSFKSIESSGALILESPRDYFAQRDEIDKASGDKNRHLTVIVRDPVVANMVKHMQSHPGVTMRTADSRTELAERWCCQIPQQATTEVIEALGLLEVAVLSKDAAGTILCRAYGDDIFLSTRLDVRAVNKLIGLLSQGPRYPEVTHSIELLAQKRLREWGENGSEIARLLASDLKKAPWFLVYALIQTYPTSVQQAVEQQLESALGRPGLISNALIPPLPSTQDIPPAITQLLSAALKPHLEAIPLPQYVQSVSGVLPIELDVLVARARDYPGAVDLTLARQVFAELDANQGNSSIDHLARHWEAGAALNFNLTSAINGKRSGEAFATLADFYISRYMSVKQVYGADSHIRERLLQWNEEYAAWLVDNYHLLAAVPSPIFAADALMLRISKSIESGRIPLVLVIDGLAWPAFLRLRTAAEQAGFYVIDPPQPCLAPLPTLTEIGMTTLIAGTTTGNVAQSHPDRSIWRQTRDTYFLKNFPGARIGRANNITQITATLAEFAPLYLLYILAVDNQVHDPIYDHKLFSDWLDFYFKALFQWLMQAVEASDLHDHLANLELVIATDHGYTDILREGIIPLPAQLDTDRILIQVASPHHCALEVNLPKPHTAEGDALREQLSTEWYVIEGDAFGLPESPAWLLPKQQKRIRGGALRVHGRPSFEETIVPLATFSFYRPTPTDIELHIQGRLVKGEQSMVVLIVMNRSSWVMRDSVVTIPDLEIEAKIQEVQPQGAENIEIQARPQRSGDQIVKASVSAPGGMRNSVELRVSVLRSEDERLLGDDRVSRLFDEEEL